MPFDLKQAIKDHMAYEASREMMNDKNMRSTRELKYLLVNYVKDNPDSTGLLEWLDELQNVAIKVIIERASKAGISLDTCNFHRCKKAFTGDDKIEAYEGAFYHSSCKIDQETCNYYARKARGGFCRD